MDSQLVFPPEPGLNHDKWTGQEVGVTALTVMGKVNSSNSPTSVGIEPVIIDAKGKNPLKIEE